MDYDEDWDDDVYYATASRPGDRGSNDVAYSGTGVDTKISSRGRRGDGGSAGDRQEASSTAKGAQDRTPTKRRYMKVPNMRQRRGMRPAASPKTVELITSMANMPHLVKLSDIASDQTSKISGLPATDVERSWKTSTPSSCTGGEGISVAAARDLTPSSVLHEGGSESAEAQGSDACSSKIGTSMSLPCSPHPMDIGTVSKSPPTSTTGEKPASPEGHRRLCTMEEEEKNKCLVDLRSSPESGGRGKRTASSPFRTSPSDRGAVGRCPAIGRRVPGEEPQAILHSSTKDVCHVVGRETEEFESYSASSGVRSSAVPPGKRRRQSSGMLQRPSAWPKLPGEGSSQGAELPQCTTLRQGGSADTRKKDMREGERWRKTSRLRRPDWLDREARGQALPTPSAPRQDDAEFDESRRKRRAEKHQHDQNEHRYWQDRRLESDGDQPSSSGLPWSSSSSTPHGTQGSSEHTSSGSSGTPPSSNSLGAPRDMQNSGHVKVGASRERRDGSIGGYRGAGSRGPSVVDRPARWLTKGSSSSLRAFPGSTAGRPTSAPMSGSKRVAGSLPLSRRDADLDSGGRKRGDGRTLKLSCIFQITGGASTRPSRASGIQKGQGCETPRFDPTRMSAALMAPAAMEEVEEVGSDDGQNGSPVMGHGLGNAGWRTNGYRSNAGNESYEAGNEIWARKSTSSKHVMNFRELQDGVDGPQERRVEEKQDPDCGLPLAPEGSLQTLRADPSGLHPKDKDSRDVLEGERSVPCEEVDVAKSGADWHKVGGGFSNTQKLAYCEQQEKKIQQDQQWQGITARTGDVSTAPQTPLRPGTFCSSMARYEPPSAQGDPIVSAVIPSASVGKAKGHWRPSFGGGEGCASKSPGMSAHWMTFSTPMRMGALGASVPAGSAMALSMSARRRKGGGAGSGALGKLLQKVRARFDGDEARLLSGEFPFRQALLRTTASRAGAVPDEASKRRDGANVISRRDHGDPRTRCKVALDVTVLQRSNRTGSLDIKGQGIRSACEDIIDHDEAIGGLVCFSCFVHQIVDLTKEVDGPQSVGRAAKAFRHVQLLEGRTVDAIFKVDTWRALDIAPGSQLRVYDPCYSSPTLVGETTRNSSENPLLLLCTQLCESYPSCLPPLKHEPASPAGLFTPRRY